MASRLIKSNLSYYFSANITGIKSEEVIFPVFMKLLRSGEIQTLDTLISKRPAIINTVDKINSEIISNAVNNPSALSWLGTTCTNNCYVMMTDFSEFRKEMHPDITTIESYYQGCGEGNSDIPSTYSRWCFNYQWIFDWYVIGPAVDEQEFTKRKSNRSKLLLISWPRCWKFWICSEYHLEWKTSSTQSDERRIRSWTWTVSKRSCNDEVVLLTFSSHSVWLIIQTLWNALLQTFPHQLALDTSCLSLIMEIWRNSWPPMMSHHLLPRLHWTLQRHWLIYINITSFIEIWNLQIYWYYCIYNLFAYLQQISSVNPNDAVMAVVTDFGVSKFVTGTTLKTGVTGTAGFRAPEIIVPDDVIPVYVKTLRDCVDGFDRYTNKCDIFAFGVILWMLVTGKKSLSSTMSSAEIDVYVWEMNKCSMLNNGLHLSIHNTAFFDLTIDVSQHKTGRRFSIPDSVISQQYKSLITR